MDLNTLNLDPDPGFWPNLDGSGIRVQSYRYAVNFKIQINFFLAENNFLYKKVFFFFNYKNKMSTKEILVNEL